MKPKRFDSTGNDSSSVREPGRTDSGADHGPMKIYHEICDENTFLNILCNERNRTERSEKPFLLLLIEIDQVLQADPGGEALKTILSVLPSSKRETDICGWYENGHKLGMIFTEIDPIDTQEARKAISTKIRKKLSANIPHELMMKISVSFHFYPEKYDTAGEKLELFEKSLYPDIQLDVTTKVKGQLIKRVVDIIGSSLALLLFSPVFCLLSLFIVVNSKGPVLFRQERLGQFGKKFIFLKFRSMYVHTDDSIHREYIKKLITENMASEEDHNGVNPPVYKIRNDPRVTPVGRFLRKTSLDELPQLLNVLKGEMSLVGPRPAIPYEFKSYDIWHRYRLLQVKPGITGLWQVTGRSSTSFDEMVRLDLKYIHEWSLWLDLKILLLTPLAVIKGKGAY
jgi:exopolysaccharide biosynthesis polyprenyl glycosylphosphotransferase